MYNANVGVWCLKIEPVHARHRPHLAPETRVEGLERLARIEGQVRGLQRMIEDDRYCVDIIIQVSAVRGALRQVSRLILHNYLANCVNRAIGEGDQRSTMN